MVLTRELSRIIATFQLNRNVGGNMILVGYHWQCLIHNLHHVTLTRKVTLTFTTARQMIMHNPHYRIRFCESKL